MLNLRSILEVAEYLLSTHVLCKKNGCKKIKAHTKIAFLLKKTCI